MSARERAARVLADFVRPFFRPKHGNIWHPELREVLRLAWLKLHEEDPDTWAAAWRSGIADTQALADVFLRRKV